jgi:hypothetical protein
VIGQPRARRRRRRRRVHELRATKVAVEKLGSRGISTTEAEQLPRNRYITVNNPSAPIESLGRLLLIGHTDGGRPLTLVIEPTADSSVWLIITGWSATARERTILKRSSR